MPFSFLKNLFRKPVSTVKKPEDDRDWLAIVKAARETLKKLKKPAIALSLDYGSPSGSDPHSSIGGRPSLPTDMNWPRGENGKPMIFLAQLNYAELPKLDGYPETGLLSVFVTDDDLNGCDFPSYDQKGFRIFYFEHTGALERRDYSEPWPEFHPFGEELFKHGLRLTGASSIGGVMPMGYQAEKLMEDWYPGIPDDLWDEFTENMSEQKPATVYFGGHPDFTQYDFRSDDCSSECSEVLLQVGFEHSGGHEWGICWGDAGEACFMISKDDLKDKRFKKTAYNWDCC